jgi:integrase
MLMLTPREGPAAAPRFRTIANFGYFARAIKHMRFPSRIRESPHFPASTRPIVKHIFGTSRGRIGGLELPPKMVQQRMGHASIVITMDVYGHLFPRGDDGAELAAAEKVLLPVAS